MGVPKFYRWISERYPCLSETVKDHQNMLEDLPKVVGFDTTLAPLQLGMMLSRVLHPSPVIIQSIPEFDNLYLDMNGIVHVCSHPDDGNPHFRITEEKIFADIFHYLEMLFRMIKPRKVFFMAIDGVAPRAKMNQQRGRRFRSANEAEVLEKRATSRGETLPTEARFDSNCITPGTPFMDRLHKQLQYFVVSKMSTDKLWNGVTVYLSGHETPGEGEHKIMDFIRSEKARSDYDPNTRHCLYGLDADLIMLGLTTHEPHFALLREEVRFGKQTTKRTNTVEETTFHLLHISLLREYLDLEFSEVKQRLHGFTYDLERVIDDWVLMGFLVGNDFIPHLPHLHIAQDALPTIWSTYRRVLPSLGGYLNNKGKIHMHRLEMFLKELSAWEYDRFSDGYADMKWMDGKAASGKAFGRGKKNQNQKNSQPQLEMRELDEFFDNEQSDEQDLPTPYIPERLEEEDTLSYDFRKHKSAYYFEKMDLQATPEVLTEQAEGYVLGLQWILHYYYTGVPSWGWFFPHHYAPYLSDLQSFSHLEVVLEPGTPFLPFQQLMAVLPAASKDLLPECYQNLMLSELSPIVDFYPQEFDTDLNGKQQDWEAVVLIPFINEENLIAAMKSVEHKLTKEETARNVHGPCLIYRYTETSQGPYQSSVAKFPNVAQNHTTVSSKDWKDFVVSIEELQAGLCADVKPTLYYPGFPTFAHIKIQSYLQKMGVTVFQQASRNENRIVQIQDDMDIDDIDLTELGNSLLGESIWVNWPHMYEAKVYSVETDEEKVEFGGVNNREIVKTTSDGTSQNIFRSLSESIGDRMEKKKGVDIGPTFVLIHAQPITGRKYVYLKDGRVTVDKEWQTTTVPFALQACVRNEKMLKLGVESPGSVQLFSLSDIFPVGCTVYILAHPYYGCEAEVINHPENRVRINVNQLAEPDLRAAKEFKVASRYMKAYEIAQHLGVSSHFVSRITGTMFLANGKENLNVGLELKNNKKNEECPGFSRKEGTDWLYSQATEDILYDYLERFPDFCGFLHDNLNKDKNSVESAFPENSQVKCKQLMEYVKSLPTYNCPRARCGNQFLETATIAVIEKLVNKNRGTHMNPHTMTVKPSLIYKQYSLTSTMMPDANADFQLFDRVVNVRMGYTVPHGLRGTVIGVITGQDLRDVQIEIMFDESFPCGLATRCTPGKGYRCPPHSLINITYGERVAAAKGFTSKQNKKQTTSRSSPQVKQPKSYSGVVNKSSTPPATNKNMSNSTPPPQMTVLKRPESSKSMSNSTKGSALVSSGDGKPVSKATARKGSPDVRSLKKGSPSETAKSSSPRPTKAKEMPTSAPTLKPSKMADSKKVKAIEQKTMLMTPSEFITPKTKKLDGRRQSNEKPNHADMWTMLKAEKSNTATGVDNTNVATNFSHAMAAVKDIQPPIAQGASYDNSIVIEKISMTTGEQVLSPKPGEKIDIQSLLGFNASTPVSKAESSSQAKKEKKNVSRELYEAGKPKTREHTAKEKPVEGSRSTDKSTNVVMNETMRMEERTTSEDHSSGGFDFQSLVSALEQNMSNLSLSPQASKPAEVTDPAAVSECGMVTSHEPMKNEEKSIPVPHSQPQVVQQPMHLLNMMGQPIIVSQQPQQPQLAAFQHSPHGPPHPMQPMQHPQLYVQPQPVQNPQQQVQQQHVHQPHHQVSSQQVQQQQNVQQQNVQQPQQQMQQPPQQVQQPQQNVQQNIQHVQHPAQPLPRQLLRQQPYLVGPQYFQPRQLQLTGMYRQPLQIPRMFAMHPGMNQSPDSSVILSQWASSAHLPPPEYQLTQVQTLDGAAYQATVYVGTMRFQGAFTHDKELAKHTAAEAACASVTRAVQSDMRNVSQVPTTPLSMVSTAPAVQAMATANTTTESASPFVPMQVTRKKAHEDKARIDPESPVQAEPVAPTTNPPEANNYLIHAVGEQKQQTMTKKTPIKTNSTNRKKKAAKSRLAANFGPPQDT